jgi:hypothetical protein
MQTAMKFTRGRNPLPKIRPRAEVGRYLPPKKPYLTFARKAALVTRKTSTDMGVIFFTGVTSFLEVEVLESFSRFAV